MNPALQMEHSVMSSSCLMMELSALIVAIVRCFDDLAPGKTTNILKMKTASMIQRNIVDTKVTEFILDCGKHNLHTS